MASTNISGWYYDLQLQNRLTCATLHPNQVLSDNQSKWINFTSKGDPDYPKEYREKPICRAIINEDFNVSVANSWSDFGGDMLGQMWESIKPLAPYADVFKEMIGKAVDDYNNPENQKLVSKINESTVSKTMADIMVAINNKLQTGEIDVTDYLNRSLVVQGTRFSYYSGSGTSFGNLMMKFTLFPTFKGKEYITVDKQVEEILPYCIGKYVSGSDGLTMSDENAQKAIDTMIGWQKPPGGFKANVQDVDVIQKGTLMLRFGAYYAITNLVVENANFNFSKQMTKNPVPGGEVLSPLYCDVTIQLRPATKYSDVSLRKFVLSRASIKTIEGVTTEMEKCLKAPSSITDYVY